MSDKSGLFDTYTFTSNGDRVYDVSPFEAVFYTAINTDPGSVTLQPKRAVSSDGAYVDFGTALTLNSAAPGGAVIDVRGVNHLKFTAGAINYGGSETIPLDVCGDVGGSNGRSHVLESDLMVPDPGGASTSFTETYDVSAYNSCMYSVKMNKATGYINSTFSRSTKLSGNYATAVTFTTTSDTPEGGVIDLRGVNYLKVYIESVNGDETVTLNLGAWS